MREKVISKGDEKTRGSIQIPNTLIFSPQNFEKYEKKLLYLSLHYIKQKQLPTKQLELDFGGEGLNETLPERIDIERIGEGHNTKAERTIVIPFKVASENGEWRSFIEASRTFSSRKINFSYVNPKTNEEHSDEDLMLVERCKRELGVGIRIVFNQTGYEILTHLSKNYSKIPLEYALLLNSKYTQRLYEILVSRCFGSNFGNWEIGLNKFRELLGIEPGKYEHWGSLEKATLLKAKEEFSHKDPTGKQIIPIYFDYKTVKKGRKVVGLKFDISILSDQTGFQLDAFTKLDEKQNAIINTLKELRVAEKYWLEIAFNHQESFFAWNYTRKMSKKPIENPAGHLLKCLGLV